MNGEHELRLERIEQSLAELHERLDGMVEQGAVNGTEILSLKWGLRVLFGAVLRVGGLTLHGGL